MPSGQAARVSRRSLLASIPLAAFTMIAAGGAEGPRPSRPGQPGQARQSRQFGLAATGLDDATVQRSQAAAQQLGRRLDVLTVYEAFVWERSLPTTFLDAADKAGCTPELTWEPWDPRAGKHQEAYTAGQIAGGRYDTYVGTWAKQAASYDKPFRLRFAHEMNGDWYPWAVGTPGGSPQDYVAAYRRSPRHIRRRGSQARGVGMVPERHRQRRCRGDRTMLSRRQLRRHRRRRRLQLRRSARPSMDPAG